MIHLIFDATIAEGKTAECQEVVASLVEATRAHDGVETYEFFISEDGTRLHGVERYGSAAALGAHVEALGEESLGRLMATLGGPPRMVALGELPAEMKAAFGAMGMGFASSVGGFTR